MRHNRAQELLILSGGYEATHHRILLRRIPRACAAGMVQPAQKSSDVRVAAQVAEVLRGHEADSRKELASHRQRNSSSVMEFVRTPGKSCAVN